MRYCLLIALTFIFNDAIAKAPDPTGIKCRSEIPNYSYAVIDRKTKNHFLSRESFYQSKPDGVSKSKEVSDFYNRACDLRTTPLTKHAIPIARIGHLPEHQSLWIDAEGTVEFDAWATAISKTDGLKMYEILRREKRKLQNTQKSRQ